MFKYFIEDPVPSFLFIKAMSAHEKSLLSSPVVVVLDFKADTAKTLVVVIEDSVPFCIFSKANSKCDEYTALTLVKSLFFFDCKLVIVESNNVRAWGIVTDLGCKALVSESNFFIIEIFEKLDLVIQNSLRSSNSFSDWTLCKNIFWYPMTKLTSSRQFSSAASRSRSYS